MSKTVIPSSSKGVVQPGKNQKYVNSRGGGKAEHSMTKRESMKHQNPEFFKRQSDRKNHDEGFNPKQFSKGTMY